MTEQPLESRATIYKFFVVEWHENTAIVNSFISKTLGSFFFWMCVGIGFILIPTFANSAYRDMLPPKELVIDLTKFLDSRFVPIALIACMVFIFIISVVKAVTKNMNLVKTTNILSSGLDDAAGQIIGVGSMFMATAFIVFIIGQQGGLEVAHLKPTKFFRSGLEYWLLAFFGYWLGCRLNVFKPSIPTQDAN